MRDDLLALDAADAAWFLSLIRFAERLADRHGIRLPPEVAHRKSRLAAHVSRVIGDDAATTRPADEPFAEHYIDAAVVAAKLGLTIGAIAKRCREGEYIGIARKVGPRWQLPASVLDDEGMQ